MSSTQIFSKYKCIGVIGVILVLAVFNSCQTEESSTETEVELTELTDFTTVLGTNDSTLAVPAALSYHPDGLFIYAKSKAQILQLSSEGEILNTYGRSGRGPGEFLKVNNIFTTANHVYAVDELQYFIHKYEIGGDLQSSMDYGKVGGFGRPNVPMAPSSSNAVYAENINNKPAVTLRGNVLLSGVQFSDSVKNVYQLIDWQGNHLANIGEIPKGSEVVLDYKKLREDVSNQVIPAFYRANAFPVMDASNPQEFFLIYSAFPTIEKYTTNGELLWSKQIENIPEIDSIATQFYESMEEMQQTDIRNRINLEYYVSGTSGPRGDLFLVMDTNPLVIHRFSNEGVLITRYVLKSSDDVELAPIFDVNFDSSHIFVVTKAGEIRAYSYQ